MNYIINDLNAKVNLLKSSPSTQVIREIECLLRDINRSESIPQHIQADLAKTLSRLSEAYDSHAVSNIPHLVISIVNKIKANDMRKANAGKIATEGQQTMNKNIRDKLSSYHILQNFGINLWH